MNFDFGVRSLWGGFLEFFSPFSGSGVFSARLSLPPSPPSPPSLLGAGPGALSLLPCACGQDTGHPVPAQAGAPCHVLVLSFLSPLSAWVGRLPPLPPPSLFLSLLSSLSLSCMQALHQRLL